MTKETKKTTTVKELTEQLKWRLTKPISLDDVEKMLSLDIIKEEEAKQLLFSVDKPKDKEVEALKEQVEFLEGIIERMSNNKTTVWNMPYMVHTHYPTNYWHTCGTLGMSGTYAINANSVSLSSSGLSNLTSSGVGASYTLGSTSITQ